MNLDNKINIIQILKVKISVVKNLIDHFKVSIEMII